MPGFSVSLDAGWVLGAQILGFTISLGRKWWLMVRRWSLGAWTVGGWDAWVPSPHLPLCLSSPLTVIQYLHRFRWPHLSEHLAWEHQAQAQRLRAEIAQAKRETGFYLRSVEKAQRPAPTPGSGPSPASSWGYCQRPTEPEIQQHRGPTPIPALLHSIFGTKDE